MNLDNHLAYGLALSLLLLTACVPNSHSEVSMSGLPSVENDLRAIEAINQRDVQFAKAGDKAGMMSQWTDDFVLLPPAGPILRGRSVIAEALGGANVPKSLSMCSTFRRSRFSATMPTNGGRTATLCGPRKVARRSVPAAS